LHAGSLPQSRVSEIEAMVGESEGLRRFLTREELRSAGYGHAAFGFCADAGYCYLAFGPGHKADHGYLADMPDYNVFYLARGPGFEPGASTQGGSLLDIAPLVAKRLGLELNS